MNRLGSVYNLVQHKQNALNSAETVSLKMYAVSVSSATLDLEELDDKMDLWWFIHRHDNKKFRKPGNVAPVMTVCVNLEGAHNETD